MMIVDKHIGRITLIALLALVLALGSCSLKRDNPLDPVSHPDIVVPDIVSEVTTASSPAGASNKFVIITWRSNSPITTTGYYVYRGLGYYSTYTVVDTVYVPTNPGSTTSCTHGAKPWHTVFPGEYYYKISAFKQYPAGRLEGRQSQPAWVRVPV